MVEFVDLLIRSGYNHLSSGKIADIFALLLDVFHAMGCFFDEKTIPRGTFQREMTLGKRIVDLCQFVGPASPVTSKLNK